MNKYGARAKKHWEEHLPSRYQSLSDPESYFTEMGEQISYEVRELSLALSGDDPPEETYEDKLGRLNMARLEAEGRVMREIALLDPETRETSSPSAPRR